MVLPALYYNVYEPITSRRIRPAVPENKKNPPDAIILSGGYLFC